MTDLQDPLAGIPEQAPAPTSAPGGDLGELWRAIIPWADLNIKGQPERYLKLGQEILPTLAVLAAQGEDRPRLLKVDAANRLLATANPNPVARLVNALFAGGSILTVDNPDIFPGGSYVYVTSATGASFTGPHLVLSVQGNQLQLVAASPYPFNAGDLVVGVPAFVTSGHTARDRHVDTASTALPAIAAGAQIVFPAQANFEWTLAYLSAKLRATTAVQNQAVCTIWDGPVGTGAKPWLGQLAVPATINAVDQIMLDRLPVRSQVGNQLAIDIPAAGAGSQLSLAAGAWKHVPMA